MGPTHVRRTADNEFDAINAILDAISLNYRPQILLADRLGNIARLVEHLDFSATVTRSLSRIA